MEPCSSFSQRLEHSSNQEKSSGIIPRRPNHSHPEKQNCKKNYDRRYTYRKCQKFKKLKNLIFPIEQENALYV